MPMNHSCSLDALDENIGELIKAGHARDQAVAIAHETLRQGCKGEGKSTPSNKDVAGVVSKYRRAAGERSSDYMAAALERAKAALSADHFAIIHAAARASAGGRASARMRAVEKAMAFGPAALTDSELAEAADQAGASMADELLRDVPPISALIVGWMDGEAARRQSVAKGFYSGGDCCGAHAHGLARSASKTRDDGAHGHIFKMPGTGDLIYTSGMDGDHEHAIGDDKARTAKDGAHSHRLMLPDGTALETGIDGKHAHELLEETSAFGAQHQHGLTLPDGTVIWSEQVTDCIARNEARGNQMDSPPLPAAFEILSAIGRIAELRGVIGDMRERIAYLESLPAMRITGAAEGIGMSLKMASADGQEVEASIADGVLDDFEAGDIVAVQKNDDGLWEVAGHHLLTAPDAMDDGGDEPILFTGPEDARVVFVAGAPDALEIARGEALVGDQGAYFAERYLLPLGLTKAEVAVGFACPIDPGVPVHEVADQHAAPYAAWLREQVARYEGAVVVALGRVAKNALGPIAQFWLPHPVAARLNEDRHAETVARKLRSVRKALDAQVFHVKQHDQQSAQPGEGAATETPATSGSEAAGPIVKIAKAADEKQIVYGVVLDPYEEDTQGEWVPPAEVEQTSHDYVKKSRVVGLEHKERSTAQVVESWLVQYPSARDRELAMANQPHRVYEMPFGNEMVKSGTWLMGAQLGDADWAAYQRGEITGFSIGGFSYKTKMPLSVMPKIEVIPLRG